MHWREEEVVPISALQHYVYCPRQCALIHVEQTFDENIFTLRGRRLHEAVHEPTSRRRSDIERYTGITLWSDVHGLVGKSDAVEVLPDGTFVPVEHKSGRRHARLADDVQVGAQAMCLEEMFGTHVWTGAIYHATSKKRRLVPIDDALRRLVVETAEAVRNTLRSSRLPEPPADARCRHCSLSDSCLPFVVRSAGGCS